MLAEEGALHLLPPLKDLPQAMQSIFREEGDPPPEVVQSYRDLIAKDRLRKACEESSLVWELASMYTH